MIWFSVEPGARYKPSKRPSGGEGYFCAALTEAGKAAITDL